MLRSLGRAFRVRIFPFIQPLRSLSLSECVPFFPASPSFRSVSFSFVPIAARLVLGRRFFPFFAADYSERTIRNQRRDAASRGRTQSPVLFAWLFCIFALFFGIFFSRLSSLGYFCRFRFVGAVFGGRRDARNRKTKIEKKAAKCFSIFSQLALVRLFRSHFSSSGWWRRRASGVCSATHLFTHPLT